MSNPPRIHAVAIGSNGVIMILPEQGFQMLVGIIEAGDRSSEHLRERKYLLFNDVSLTAIP